MGVDARERNDGAGWRQEKLPFLHPTKKFGVLQSVFGASVKLISLHTPY